MPDTKNVEMTGAFDLVEFGFQKFKKHWMEFIKLFLIIIAAFAVASLSFLAVGSAVVDTDELFPEVTYTCRDGVEQDYDFWFEGSCDFDGEVFQDTVIEFDAINGQAVALGAVALIAMIIGGSAAQLSTVSLSLAAARDKKDSVKVMKAVKHGLSRVWPMVGIGLLVLLGASVAVGLTALIAVAIHPATLFVTIPVLLFLLAKAVRKLFLTQYIIIDSKLGTMDVIKESARISDQNPGAIWSVFGVTLLVSMAGGLIPFIGGIISTAFQMVYGIGVSQRYLELKKLYPNT